MVDVTAPVSEGEILADKYRVQSILGVGGMGVVVAAQHIHLGQRVAIKFLRQEALANTEAVERFLREARAAVRIQNEHVARVSDVGTLHNGAPYMVMEHLEGCNLAAYLSQRRVLPIPEAVDYVLQACEAIAEAHSLGIIHRDLKPANLFLIRRPDGATMVKVLDFGISKSQTGIEQASLTAVSSVMGSPMYMSPEQMRSSKNVDVRSDIWSLGVILYELLTGSTAFEADSLTGLCAMIAMDQANSMRFRRPDLPEAIDVVVLRCLEKDRAKRPQNIAELAMLLMPFGPPTAQLSVERIVRMIQSTGVQIAVPTAPAPPQPPATNTEAPWSATGSEKKKPRWLPVGIGVAAGVLIATGILTWTLLSRKSVATNGSESSPVVSVSTAMASASSSAASPTASASAVDTTEEKPPAASASAAEEKPPASKQPSTGKVNTSGPAATPPAKPPAKVGGKTRDPLADP